MLYLVLSVIAMSTCHAGTSIITALAFGLVFESLTAVKLMRETKNIQRPFRAQKKERGELLQQLLNINMLLTLFIVFLCCATLSNAYAPLNSTHNMRKRIQHITLMNFDLRLETRHGKSENIRIVLLS